MNKTVATAASIAATSALALALAPAAQATDLMYRLGTEVSPGDYTYTVVGAEWGSWELCPDANCASPTDMDVIDGTGHTGYLTVTSGTRFVKLTNLQLRPM
jgi:hypothetical protein